MDKKKFKPLVSIIIPVFNGDKYLFDSLSSVIHQSYDNIEIIIIDDGSYKNNQYRPILKKFKNQNIRFLKRRKNAGVSKVMNLAIKKSKGEYVNWLSHDDIIHPLKIEKQINLIRQYPNKKILCFSHSISFNENSS